MLDSGRLKKGSFMDRDTLHALVDRIPEDELATAKRFLEYLTVNPAYRAALSAPMDDEPVTEADIEAITRAREDFRAGKFSSHDDLLREFGLR
jgi:hypothetical protein